MNAKLLLLGLRSEIRTEALRILRACSIRPSLSRTTHGNPPGPNRKILVATAGAFAIPLLIAAIGIAGSLLAASPLSNIPARQEFVLLPAADEPLPAADEPLPAADEPRLARRLRDASASGFLFAAIPAEEALGMLSSTALEAKALRSVARAKAGLDDDPADRDWFLAYGRLAKALDRAPRVLVERDRIVEAAWNLPARRLGLSVPFPERPELAGSDFTESAGGDLWIPLVATGFVSLFLGSILLLATIGSSLRCASRLSESGSEELERIRIENERRRIESAGDGRTAQNPPTL